jgi:hypothetical protein
LADNTTHGAKLDGNDLIYLRGHPDMIIDQVEYLKGDTYLLIEGYKVATPDDRQDRKKA